MRTPTIGYAVEPVDGLKRSDRRAIAFLSGTDNDAENAGAAFRALDRKRDRELRDRFDYWIDGGVQDKWFHGWPNNPTCRACFVFKWKEKRKCHRFYGFLCHPKPTSNPRFVLCVLVSHASKVEWETDLTELDGLNVLRVDAGVLAAVDMVFSDMQDGQRRWLN